MTSLLKLVHVGNMLSLKPCPSFPSCIPLPNEGDCLCPKLFQFKEHRRICLFSVILRISLTEVFLGHT